MGKTLQYILEHCSLDSNQLSELSSSMVKKNMKYREASEANEWRVKLAMELVDARDGKA